jgi:hypothetical protein
MLGLGFHFFIFFVLLLHRANAVAVTVKRDSYKKGKGV